MNSSNILICCFSFLCMEGIAWLTHKYVMHGFLWSLHKDHHQPNSKAALQKNDYFFLLFAIPGVAGLLWGLAELNTYFWIGLGITLYGFCYFFIHDLFIHQRIKVLRNTSFPYLIGVRRAHKAHHKNLQKEEGHAFGMLLFPLKYWP